MVIFNSYVSLPEGTLQSWSLLGWKIPMDFSAKKIGSSMIINDNHLDFFVIFQCQVKTFNQDPVPKKVHWPASCLPETIGEQETPRMKWSTFGKPKHPFLKIKSWDDTLIRWRLKDSQRFQVLLHDQETCLKWHETWGCSGNGNGSSFSPNGNCSIGKWLIFFLKAWHPPRAVFPPFYSVTSERRPKYLWQWDNGPDKKHLEQWPPGYSSSRIRFLFLVYAAVYREWIQTYP